MTHKALFILVGGCLFAVPVAAQENTEFTGPKIEAIIGYDRVEISPDAYSGEMFDESADDFAYGIAVGYDYQVTNLVFGIEAELMESGLGANATVDDTILGYVVDGTASLDASEDIYVGARLGYVIGDQTMLYAKGGYSMANAKFEAVGSIDGVAGALAADLKFEGFRVGAGIETQMADNFIVKAEYRYSSYGSGEVSAEGMDFDAGEVFDYIDLTRHQVVAGIGYRF